MGSRSQHARIMEQFVKRSQDKEGGYSVRDASMAENVQWILSHEGSDQRSLYGHTMGMFRLNKILVEESQWAGI